MRWIAVVIALSSLGCHAAKDDAKGQAKELSDPVRRENAIYNLNEIYASALAEHNGIRSEPAVTEVSDTIVKPLIQTYLEHPEDRVNGLDILNLLHKMQDPRSVPALIEALNWRTEVSEQHAIRAAQTLQSIEVPSENKPEVIQALGHALDRITGARPIDNKMRIAMIRALGSMNDPSATPILSRIATKQDENQDFLINRLAVQQLGELRDPAAIPALVQALVLFEPQQPDIRMNDVAAEALVRIGRPSLKPLLRVMNGKDNEVNGIAQRYIATLKARRPDLANQITVAQIAGAEATFVLGALGFEEALNALLKEVKSNDPARRLNAAIALVRIDVPDAQRKKVRTALKEAYDSLPQDYEGMRMRSQLLAAIAHTYDAALMPFILKEMTDKSLSPIVRLVAAQNYVLLANRVEARKMRAAIASERKSGGGGYREKFLEYKPLLKLAQQCNKNVNCWIKKFSTSDDPDTIRKAAYMLGRYGVNNKKVIALLVDGLSNQDLGVRLSSLIALDHIAVDGSPAAVAKIDELRKQEEGRSIWTHFRKEALPIQARLWIRNTEG